MSCRALTLVRVCVSLSLSRYSRYSLTLIYDLCLVILCVCDAHNRLVRENAKLNDRLQRLASSSSGDSSTPDGNSR